MIPNTGAIAASTINSELGRGATNNLSLDDKGVRGLTRNAGLLGSGGQISMSDLRGGKSYEVTAYIQNQGDGTFGAVQGDGVNATPLGSAQYASVRQIRSGVFYDPNYYTTVRFGGDPAAPRFYQEFWGLGIWNGVGAFLAFLKFSDASLFEGISGLHGVGWKASDPGYIDLSPYAGQWLKFAFFDS